MVSVGLSVWERELSVEHAATIPEAANSTLASVINFLILNSFSRGQRVVAGGGVVAASFVVFHLVIVAQKLAQRVVEVNLKNQKTPGFIE